MKTTAGIVVLVLIAIAAVVPVMPCPYCHRHRVPLLLWIARELEEIYTGERRSGNCVPLDF